MDNLNFFEKLQLYKMRILAITLTVTALALVISFLQPLKYRSTLRLLVVQEGAQATDAYTLMRSNEYLGKLLANVTYSTSFAEKVFANSGGVDRSYFGNTPRKLATTWTQALDVKNLSETGSIEINAYHTNRDQAELLARAIGSNLIASNGEYHGLGDQVKIKVLDEPITTNWPVKPNVLVNLCLGLAAGLAVGVAYAYFAKDQPAYSLAFNEPVSFAPHLAYQPQAAAEQWQQPLAASEPLTQPNIEEVLWQPAVQPVEAQAHTINANSYYAQGGSVDRLLTL